MEESHGISKQNDCGVSRALCWQHRGISLLSWLGEGKMEVRI